VKTKVLGIAAVLALLGAWASTGKADVLLFSIKDEAWGNTDWTPNAPKSFVVTLGACSTGALNCPNAFVPYGPWLDAINFLPSASSQSVTITSGAAFDDVASVIDGICSQYTDIYMLIHAYMQHHCRGASALAQSPS
jgi:hypothetical protein